MLGVVNGPVTAAPDITYTNITDVRDVSFVVSWLTDAPSNGTVRWGTSIPPVNTTADTVLSTTTHYVRLDGLVPLTTYYFQVESGADVDNNGGAYYQVTTGPSIAPRTGGTVYGYVYQSGGSTPAANAIVFLALIDANGAGSAGQSQWVTARAASNGLWSYNLSNVRTSNAGAYFDYSSATDNLRLVWQGGVQGTRGYPPNPLYVVAVPPANPPFLITTSLIDAPTAVSVSSFEGDFQSGAVRLKWATGNEVSLAGFNIYRSETPQGSRSRLNASILSALNPGQMLGGLYHFVDRATPGKTYFYWLEWIDRDVTIASEVFGPLEISSPYVSHLPLVIE